jgi:hypothetical protein
LPYHARNVAVQSNTSVLHSISLAILAWFVTTQRTAFHSYSHLAPKDESLTERIASTTPSSPTASLGLGGGTSGGVPSVWKLGGKVKLRLD